MYNYNELKEILHYIDDFYTNKGKSYIPIEVGGSAAMILQNRIQGETKDIDILARVRSNRDYACTTAYDFDEYTEDEISELNIFVEEKLNIPNRVEYCHENTIDFNCGQVIELLPDYISRLVTFDDKYRVLGVHLLSKTDWVYSNVLVSSRFGRLIEAGKITKEDVIQLSKLSGKHLNNSRAIKIFDYLKTYYVIGENLT